MMFLSVKVSTKRGRNLLLLMTALMEERGPWLQREKKESCEEITLFHLCFLFPLHFKCFSVANYADIPLFSVETLQKLFCSNNTYVHAGRIWCKHQDLYTPRTTKIYLN